MKVNQWTLGLAAAGVVSLASTVQAEEAKQAISSALSSTTLSGYVDTSAIWRFGTANGRALPGRSYDGVTKQDGFNLNVVKVSLEKPLDEGQWAAGYKVDLLFGPDAAIFQGAIGGPAGLGVVANAESKFIIKQAYVNLRAPVGNGLDFKVGVFDTIIGYEVFDAGNNPNYSRSFGYGLEPTTYTGILASYRINDIVSLSGGIADAGAVGGINTRGATESIKSYMASLSLTAPKDWGFLKGSTLYAGVIDHGQTTAGNPTADTLNLYVGGTLATPVAGLSVGAAYDYRGTGNRAGNPASGTWANAASVYASFKATDKLTLNARGEYTWAETGFYGTGKGGTAESDKFIAGTFTADYALWANVVSRAEFRWDHDAAGGAGAFSGKTGSTLRNNTSVALNIIYKF